MHITLLPVHIVAGGLAIILGGVALAASKGATLHRLGLLFVRRLNSPALAVVIVLSLMEIEAGHRPAPPLQVNNMFPMPDHHVVRWDCVRLRSIGRQWT